MQVLYATRDGQSRRIAERIAARLSERGLPAATLDLAAASRPLPKLSPVSLVVVVAAVRYGRHLPEADRFLAEYRKLAAPPPLALASVNLTARKPGKARTNPYLGRLIARHGLRPALATAFAGRLDYPRYGWLDRQIIRLIMKVTGGPTDPQACVDYTSWTAVDDFASSIAELQGRVAGAAPLAQNY